MVYLLKMNSAVPSEPSCPGVIPDNLAERFLNRFFFFRAFWAFATMDKQQAAAFLEALSVAMSTALAATLPALMAATKTTVPLPAGLPAGGG